MRLAALSIVAVLSTACGGSGDGGAATAARPSALDGELRLLANALGLTADPASTRAAVQSPPDTDALVKLGQLLFFSQTLSAGYDVSCATCHHPDFGASDDLSISVGVVPMHAATVGPGREVDAARDLDPRADGGPNMHRNSITTFNAALFDRALMYDGRVSVLDEDVVAGGQGQAIRTPESGFTHDRDPVSGLLEFTVKGPIVNDNEMRGFAYTNYPTAGEYREHLVRRLRGEVDTEYNSKPDGPENWLSRFRAGFAAPNASAAELVTVTNVQKALAAYVSGQIFVDTPWRDYLDGDLAAISDDAKQGARLFLASKADGGFGCSSCHRGDRFTDEAFHNVGFPQLGRGFGRADGSDMGHWLRTNADEDLQTFRTPSLLNVAETAPYGHAGSFATLDEAIRYHADARRAVDGFDFTLQHLDQFRASGVVYPFAEAHTRRAIARPNFVAAEALLPDRGLTGVEARQLEAFLKSLTDHCVADPGCIGRWTPAIDEDPDGHLLVRDQSRSDPGPIDVEQPSDYPQQISLAFPPTPTRPTFADVESCSNRLATHNNTGATMFTHRTDAAFGLTDEHGYQVDTWFGPQQATLEIAMIGGGVSAAYLDDDCWADLVFSGGDVSGMRFYRNLGGMLFESVDLLAGSPEREFTGAAIADLDGDYRRELLFGNVKPGEVPVYAQDGAGRYLKIAGLPMTRPTFGISFAPLDASGHPYIYLAHWAGGSGTAGTSPALWKNDGASVSPWDTQARTSSAFVDQRFNFTPKFADFTGDGRLDLVIASDFETSATLRNVSDGQGGSRFVNETDREVITDQNGMGSALLDIDNDGTLEWFVTSVFDPSVMPSGNWGSTGNRLYRNASTREGIAFEDITGATGVRDGYWGWGACAADFDNDGFVDLFHVNGFGTIPQDVVITETLARVRETYAELTGERFQNKPSRLFMNNGDGTFTDQAKQWSIDAVSDGRGLSCFDFDRDGDMDIAVFDHSKRMQFHENRSGNATGRAFLNVRVVGAIPNTDAIGASVHVTADIGNGHGTQTQLRLGAANSNFNSQNPPDLHFGLGAAQVVDEVRIVWPDGSELSCKNVATNQFLVLDQRDGPAACQ